jgi:hypothetical protein
MNPGACILDAFGQFPTVMGGGGTLPLINIAPPNSQAATGVK